MTATRKRNTAISRSKPKPQDAIRKSEGDASSDTSLIIGRRAVLEALSSDTEVERVILRLGLEGKIIGEIIRQAKVRQVRLDRLPPDIFNHRYDPKSSGGVAAIISPIRTVDLNDLLQSAEMEPQSPLFLILDGIEDPQNLGAIARTAETAECAGIILPRHKSAPLNETAVKTSAGALMHLPVAKVTNISSAIDELKKRGFWVFGADIVGEDYRKVDYPEKLALVIGAEGKGISPLVKGRCDKLISIPLKGKVGSLNASVAAGILIFHLISKK